MLLTVGEVIDRVRDEYPDATDQVLLAPSLARHLSDYQQELMRMGFEVNPEFKAQQASIVFDFDDANAPETVGRGTAGGLPVVVNADASYVMIRGTTGSLIEYDLEDATVLVAPRAVLAATTTTVQAAGVAWVVNTYISRLVRITSGKGVGTSPRVVQSNTANTLTITQPWEITPDSTSMFEVLQVLPDVTPELSAATDPDPTLQRTGYLVREDANGIAYVDHSKPLRATYAAGIPLPPHLKLLGGTVRYEPASGQVEESLPLELTTHEGRAQNRGLPLAYELNGELYLAGDQRYWREAVSIDLRHVPIPPAVEKESDAFLLSDARSVFVWRGLLWTHRRAKALRIESADPAEARAELEIAEKKYLLGLRGTRPATAFKRRDTFSRQTR